MTRNIGTFLITFVVGAIVAFAARTALHEPYSEAAAASPESEYAPMVGNALTPAVPPPPADGAHAGHVMEPTEPVGRTEASGRSTQPDQPAGATGPAASPASETVNTRCAICGMPVDPKLPTVEYQGKKIGFGCRMCAPKFKADPDKYGPIYLRNEVIER